MTMQPTAHPSFSSHKTDDQHHISIVLVDDEPRFRQGLRTLFSFYQTSGSANFDVVGEAASVDQALQLIALQHPQLVLMDLELPANDGIYLLQQLRGQGFQGKVLVVSGHHEDEWVFRAMQMGANGYVFKQHLSAQLFDAIHTVLDGHVYLSAEVATSFFRLFHFYGGRSLETAQNFHLTEREQEVLHWLVQGASNEEIAAHLFITVATVKAHLTAIFQKLSVSSRTQAIIRALKLGLSTG